MSNGDTLTREQWRTVLDDTDLPTFGELISAIEATDLFIDSPEQLVEQAIADGGPLTVDAEASGAFDVYRLDEKETNQQTDTEVGSVLVSTDTAELTDEDTDTEDKNPGCEAGKTASRTVENAENDEFGSWDNADFTLTNPDTYPPELLDVEQWMGRKGKLPFAPWGDANPDDAEAGDSPRWQWGRTENYVDGGNMRIAEDDHRLDGRVFIQRESDPFAFVDGDDVRCPETGEVHPAFRAILEQLGVTYADVSTSGAGVHAYYRGELPIEGKGQATFDIDTEPWGENDSAPTVEIYANKHVCVATGDHVDGTPLDVNEWDTEVLRTILRVNGYEDKEPIAHDTDRDHLDDYEPSTTGVDETAEDIRDVYAAVDRLDARDLPLRTARTGEDSTGWETWNPSYRTSESGESLHSPPDEAVFHDHKEGEAFGLLSLFAAEQGIISNPWDRLEGSDWFDTVDAAREAGAPIPKPPESSNAEPVLAINLKKLDVLTGPDRRRAAKKRGVEIPATADARERLRNTIFREMRAENTTAVDAPTALGKSYTVATEPWCLRADVTGDAPVIQLHQTREARDEAAAATADSMATGAVLRGRKEASPLARGDHDPVDDPNAEDTPDIVVTIDGLPASEWFDRMCDRKGLAFSTALALARERNDQGLDDLPPVGKDDPAVTQWDGLPRDDDGKTAFDVVHATHQFAHVPSLRSNTNVVLDEQPDYTVDLSQERVRNMVNAYLKEIDAPTSNFEAFVMLAQVDAARGDAAAERDALDSKLDVKRTPPTEWFVENTDAHALAPDITRAIWNALRWEDTDRNGRRSTRVYHEPPRFDADKEGYTAGTWLSVVIDEDHTIQTIRATPDFSQARAVVGLDAHPSMPMWQLNVDAGITRDAVLDPTERQLWRRYERGLTVVQLGDAARPRSGEDALEWMNDDRVRTVLERLRDHYGNGFKTALSTIQTERRLRELLAEVATGIDADSTMHYGEEKSRNDFADEDAGYVYGCMDPGDDMILDALAELGLDAKAPTVETDDGETKREKGRTFDGPDADTARAVLASVRENHVAQAAGRYARNADDPDSRATVYLHTNAAPAGFVDIETPGVEWLATDLQREIIDVLAERPSATTKDLAETVGCSKEHVRKTLDRLRENDMVGRVSGAGRYGADVYHDTGAETALVELGESANSRLKCTNRWSLAIHDRHQPINGPGRLQKTSSSPSTALAGDGDPPETGD